MEQTKNDFHGPLNLWKVASFHFSNHRFGKENIEKWWMQNGLKMESSTFTQSIQFIIISLREAKIHQNFQTSLCHPFL